MNKDLLRKAELFFRKLYLVLKKNYHIATRNPKLYVSLIVGPLIFVLIIGMAFSSSQLKSDLRVGVYDESPDQSIFSAFNRVNKVLAVEQTSEEDCKYTTINKENVVCIAVVESEDGSFDVNLYFDHSRMSVYAVAYTTVREVLNAIDQRLTINLLNELRTYTDPSKFGFEDMIEDLEATEEELNSASSQIGSLVVGISSDSAFYEYKLDEVINEISNLKDQIVLHQGLVNTYRSELNKQGNDIEDLFDDLQSVTTNAQVLSQGCGDKGTDRSGMISSPNFVQLIEGDADPGCSAVKTLYGLLSGYESAFKNVRDGFRKADNDLKEVHDSLTVLLFSTDDYVEMLENEKSGISETSDVYTEEVSGFQESLEEYSEKVKDYGSLIEELNSDMNEFYVALDPAKILGRFEQNIEELMDTDSMLDFSLHLVIPFILLLSTLLISITLNRNEYKTTAFQRNKMIGDNFLIFAGNTLFILIIMLLELLFILILFKLFFGANTLVNLPYVTLIASIFIIIWITLGFIISRNINSDEGAIFSGTILGLLVFFLSDVMVPVQNFPQVILYLYNINPFVHFADVIRSNYLVGETMGFISGAPLFLLITFLLLVSICVFIVWRDKNAS